MEWFKHDTSALNDAKIKKLIIRHGAVGYAVYFHCLELIAGDVNKNNITFELEHDSEIIADNLKITGDAVDSGVEKVERIMRDIIDLGLFQCSDNRIFCFKLLKRIDTSMTSNNFFRKLIVNAKEHQETVMTPSCKIRSDKIRLDKNREEKKKGGKPPSLQEIKDHIQEKGFNIDPELFYAHYEANGWRQSNGNKIKNWKMALVTWSKRDFNKNNDSEKQKQIQDIIERTPER